MKKKSPSAPLSDTAGLTQLGSGPRTAPGRKLEGFPFRPRAGRSTTVTFHCTEFTNVCPLTGQPDFAQLQIDYEPHRIGIESKSLKLYLWSWRDTPAFHEDVVNAILDDLTAFARPQWMRITGRFNIRGGISIDVVAETKRKR